MKFLSVALAALVGFTEAKKSITGKTLKARMQKGQFNKRTLLQGAKPHSAAARKLDEDEEWEINGLYSVQFDSCLSLKVQDEDLFDEDVIYYAQNGLVTAQKSYITFQVCLTSDCYYQGEDEKLTFITDISTFFEAFANFLPNQVEAYCQGCEDNEDYCLGNLEEEEEEAEEEEAEEEDGDENDEEDDEDDEEEDGENDGEDDEDDNDRKLKAFQRKLENNALVKYIDCDLCTEYECFEDEDGDDADGDDEEDQYEFEDAIEWLEGLSQCQEIEDYTTTNPSTGNALALYGGLICNSDGTGVEIGVFLDEDCALYTTEKAYTNVMSYSDSQYFKMSTEVVEYMFTNDFSCYDVEYTYVNPTEYDADAQEDDGDDNDDNNDAPEAAEWCQDLMGGDFEALSLYDCGADEEEEDNDQQDDEEGDDYVANYDWYNYELTADDADDGAAVCVIVKALEGGYSQVYDSKSSGSLYDYRKKSSKINAAAGLSGGAITGIVIVFIAVAAAGAAWAFRGKSSDDKKKAPLINNGSMA
jgi:hypothetical protein